MGVGAVQNLHHLLAAALGVGFHGTRPGARSESEEKQGSEPPHGVNGTICPSGPTVMPSGGGDVGNAEMEGSPLHPLGT